MEVQPKTIRIYEQADGVAPFSRWLGLLRDIRGKQKILARIDRARLGNLGDCKAVGDGVRELRIPFGPGYRVYFGMDGAQVVILLSGGDKGTQNEDIKRAKEYWKDYKETKCRPIR